MNDNAHPTINFGDPVCVVCQNCAMVADQHGNATLFWCATCGSRLAVYFDEQGRFSEAKWEYPSCAPFVPPPPPPPPAPTWKPYWPSTDFIDWMRYHRPAASAALRDHPTSTANCFLKEDGEGGWLMRWQGIDFTTLHPEAQKEFWNPPGEDVDATWMYLRSHPDQLKRSPK